MIKSKAVGVALLTALFIAAELIQWSVLIIAGKNGVKLMGRRK